MCACVCLRARMGVGVYVCTRVCVGVRICLFVCGYVGVCMGVFVKIEILVSSLYGHSPADKIQPSLRPSWLRTG